MAFTTLGGFLRKLVANSTDGVGALVVTTDSTDPLVVDTATAGGNLGGDGTKNVTTAGTRVALAASTTVKWVIVTARPANTGKIVVGTVTCVAAAGSERGIVLAAGQSCAFSATNLSSIYIDATVNGEGVAFAYGT